MKKILSLLLALELVLNVASALAFSSDYRDYVDWPITDQPITVTIGIKLDNSATDWTLEDNWFFNWAMAKTGLTFEFETIQASALADQKQLLFNSDQLPDVMWGWDLTPVEMVKYGSQENMLLPLNQYMTPEIMPNLCKWLEAYPETYDVITAPDGNIYSLPYFYKLTRTAGGSTRVFINETHLKELGKEKPKTLDEMVDVLYAFKQTHPDLTPVGASASGSDLRDFFLNSYGYVCEGSKPCFSKRFSLCSPRTGDVLHFGNVQAHVLYAPNANSQYNSIGDTSLVVRFVYQGKGILITGDMTDSLSEQLLSQYGSHLRSDVVQIANHGWNNCGSVQFYQAVAAQLQLWTNSEYGFQFFRKDEGYQKTLAATAIYHLSTCRQNVFCDQVSMQRFHFPLEAAELQQDV